MISMVALRCGNVFKKRTVCNQNLSRMYIRASGNMYGQSTKLNALEDRAHIYDNDGEAEEIVTAARRCNSQEGSEAERLSVEVVCCSNGRRETGGIKLLQTITFNEKVNATSRGLARTWMQMCRRRVISKQSSPPTYHLLFHLLFLLILHTFLAATFLLRRQRRGSRETKQLISSFCLVHYFLCTCKCMEHTEYTITAGYSVNNR